jgi:hypothetical protein
MVTGPKTDLWLVKTVGLLIAIIAVALLERARCGHESRAVELAGAGSCLALLAIDVIYVRARVISSVYLLDAAVEAVLLAWWPLVWMQRGRARTDRPG